MLSNLDAGFTLRSGLFYFVPLLLCCVSNIQRVVDFSGLLDTDTPAIVTALQTLKDKMPGAHRKNIKKVVPDNEHQKPPLASILA